MDNKDRVIEALKISNKERGYLITELVSDYYIEHNKVKRLERRVNRLMSLICDITKPGRN
jgi:hypothetical protein